LPRDKFSLALSLGIDDRSGCDVATGTAVFSEGVGDDVGEVRWEHGERF
jgi:hypothetical protein